jgi:hypothetical protein
MKKDRRLRKSRPFWLPASTYYFLAAAIAIGIFFLVWAILGEARDENPWIAAGLMASASMIAAVVLREIVLRVRRNSIFIAQRKLDNAVLSAPVPVRREEYPDKLTLERNAKLLDEIKRKSEAAMVLGKLAESHKEVFELCAQYLLVAKRELPTIGVGSPRLVPITRGRDRVERIHRRHMLKWAEIEIQANTQAALETDRIGIRSERAKRALAAAEFAFEYYPDEPDIVRSREAVEDFVVSIKVAEAVLRAERAEAKGDLERALARLLEAERTALSIIGHGAEDPLNRIRDDIDRLKRLTSR